MTTELLHTTPVLPSEDIERDVVWYEQYTVFTATHHDNMYAVLKRENLYLHLQWHADTEDDPLLGGSVVRIFVTNIAPIFSEFCQRGTVPKDKLSMHTPWGTHEFGFYDLNRNAIFIVEDAENT